MKSTTIFLGILWRAGEIACNVDVARAFVRGMPQSVLVRWGDCCRLCISRLKEPTSASFPRDARSLTRSLNMLSERLKKRLAKNRPMTSITLRIPVDVVGSLKEIAPLKGVNG